ncbi:MAG: hypothetical protein ABJL67_18540 [Sulfitobacter sp.]
MIPYKLTLDYTLAPGWMAPFIDGLRANKAMARVCRGCSEVSFPPTRICTCGAEKAEWRELSGQADIAFRTGGTDGTFGLVRFRGANTQSVVRLNGIESDTNTGWLAAAENDTPHLALGPHKMKDQQ